MIQLIVYLIVLGALLYVVGLLPIDATIKTIIRVIAIVAVCIWLLYALTGNGGMPAFHLR